MKYKTTFLPVLGFSFISCFAWGDDMTVLETIKVRAEASSEHDVQTNTAATKFSHDVLDVPFNRAFIDSETLKQQESNKMLNALTMRSHSSVVFFIKTTMAVGFGIITLSVALVAIQI